LFLLHRMLKKHNVKLALMKEIVFGPQNIDDNIKIICNKMKLLLVPRIYMKAYSDYNKNEIFFRSLE
jgi:hypothetical protein